MHMQSLRFHALAFVAGAAFLGFSGWAGADPPSRVARLAFITGAASFSPAGENDWVEATINRPLTTSDRLWTDAGARAEVQLGGAMIRMHAGTGISILNLDDRIAQLELTQGTLNVRVRRLEADQVFEVDTPNLAFTLRQPGEYRIEVDLEGNATTIVVRKGQGEVYGDDASYVIDSRQAYRFSGTGLREYQYLDPPRVDEFDRWASARDSRYDNSASARYVSQDVVGYQDLDANGTWRVDAAYGNVWVPNTVDAGWVPYRDGHWAWVDPWGWTWMDDAPWGFAVSHYGRWTNLRGTWGWVPGPVRTRAYYAPALVVFVGGNDFQLTLSGGNVGGVAWFPLAPRDVYRPAYAVSRGYFENINRSNTVINNTVINNYYNNANVANVVYANRRVPGAVIAVPTTAFAQSQHVSRAAQRLSPELIGSAPVAFVPPVAPTEKSVRGAAAQRDRPPPRVFERQVVARTAPPAVHAGFAAQQQQLTVKPGKPLDDAARRELKPAAVAPAPVVKVVQPKHEAAPTMRPPPTPPAISGEARGSPDARKAIAAPAISGASGALPQVAAPAPAVLPRVVPSSPAALPKPALPQAAPAPAVPPLEQRGKSEQRGNGEQRGRPVAPPAPLQGAAPGPVLVPQAAPPPPVVQPPEQRGRSEQRGQREQVATPPLPTQRAAEPKVVPPQAVPAAPAPQAPPQRPGRPTAAPLPQVALPVPAAPPPRPKPDPAPAAKQAEPALPVAAPKPTPPAPASKAAPRGEEFKPAAGRPQDNKKDSDEDKRDEENRRQKR